MVFLGRLDEPRKGLHVLLSAFPEILRRRPGTKLLVVGRGDTKQARDLLPAAARDATSFLGMVDDETRAQALASSELYIAPNTGGESFGITLIEAMAAGAAVLASDLRAFSLVLQEGRLGTHFPVNDHAALADHAVALLNDDGRRRQLQEAASRHVRGYDWTSVARRILDVYEAVTMDASRVGEAP
jgi:phosphatidylinositol alpha-mannosyltransferase